MDINHSAVLSGRISAYIGRMLVVFCLLLGLVFLVFLQPANQPQLTRQVIPQTNNEALLLKVSIQQSIDELLQDKTLTDLVERHHDLVQQLIQFNSISQEPALIDIIKRLNSFNDVVLSIHHQAANNIEFLNDTKAQLKAVLSHLQIMTAELLAQKYLLNDRIYNADNADSRESLFQAYLELSEQIENYQTLYTNLVTHQKFLTELFSFVPLSFFDEHMAKLKNDLLLWEKKSSYLLKLTSPFNDVYKPFSDQVFSVENGMDKWRVSLQNTQSYVRFLHAEKSHIWQLAYVLPPLALDPLHVSNFLGRINEFLKSHKVLWQGEAIQFSVYMVRLILFTLMGLCLVLLVYYAIACRYNIVEVLKIKPVHGKDEQEEELEEIIDISPSLDEEHRLSTTHIEVLSEELHQLKLQALSHNRQSIEQKAKLDKAQLLVATLEKNNQVLSETHHKSLAEFKNKQQQLVQKNKQMIVRTLLQSQSASIGTGGNALQVYRHLTRMFDWCNQLATPLKENTPSVVMYNEISAALYQMMLEAHWQRNTLLLNLSVDIDNAKVDARLFQRMLVSVGRLLLLEQFKSTLTLKVRSAQQLEANNNLLFEFIVVADKNRKKIPSLVQDFINAQLNPQALQPEAVIYINQILKAINAEHLSAQQNETGYTFTFELPRNNQEQPSIIKASPVINAQLIALTEESELIQLLEQQSKAVEANFIAVANTDEAQQKSLLVDKNKAIIFLLAEDCYEKEFDSLYSFVSKQALTKCYKLMVLQSSYHCALQRQGLYPQALSPIFADTFSAQLQSLLLNKAITNECVAADVMSQHQYQTTQVEVLFFSPQAANYQTLIRVLHWLGLQVNVVANPETMKSAWQSGRYLLLITDVSETPFIELSAGKTIKRAIFTLASNDKKANKKILAQMKTWSLQCQEAKSWLIDELASVENMEALVSQLSAWLKPKIKDISAPLPAPKKTVKPKPLIQVETVEKATLLPQVVVEENGAFNLTNFADNQGSPELAVYMLDIYLAELSELQAKLTDAIKDKAYTSAQDTLSSIKLIAMIMSASPLQQACEPLGKALSAGNDNNAELPVLLVHLSSCLDTLMTFAADI